MTCYFEWSKVLSTEVKFAHRAMQIWTKCYFGSWITVVEPTSTRISSQPVLIRVTISIRYPASNTKSASLAHTNWSYLLSLPVTETYLSPCAKWLPCGLTARMVHLSTWCCTDMSDIWTTSCDPQCWNICWCGWQACIGCSTCHHSTLHTCVIISTRYCCL